jgi:hypothetical protein
MYGERRSWPFSNLTVASVCFEIVYLFMQTQTTPRPKRGKFLRTFREKLGLHKKLANATPPIHSMISLGRIIIHKCLN